MAHVLLPTDLSENALNAAVYAVRLFGDQGNRFTLLHACGIPQGSDTAWTADEQHVLEASKGLSAFAENLLHALPGLKPALERTCEPGLLPGLVRRFAEEAAPPTLVVMGTQGASGLQEILMGSNTADVIKSSGLPVLAVPAQASYRSPKRIMLADDAGPVERATLKPLLDIARWSHSEVMIVRVVSEENTMESEGDSIYDVLLGAIPHTHHYLSGENV